MLVFHKRAMCLDNVELFNKFFIIPLGVFLNILLLYIVRARSTRALAAYSIVLNISCAADLISLGYTFLLDLVGLLGCFRKATLIS
jgi:hypothetical protein